MNNATPSRKPKGIWVQIFKGYSFARLRRLALKELRETLRDRRTIITLVLMPLLLYPILSLIFQHFLITSIQPGDKQIRYEFGFDNVADKVLVQNLLTVGSLQLLKDDPPEEQGEYDGEARVRNAKLDVEKNNWRVRSGEKAPDLETMVQNGVTDVGIRISPTSVPTAQSALPRQLKRMVPFKVKCELIYNESSSYSQEALSYIQRRLEATNAIETKELLRRQYQPMLLVAESKVKNLKGDQSGQFSIATLVPLILILMTITGAVYPAIDLTAGERERGTLETLIAAPIPRIGLLMAKYIAVVVVSMLTALVNIVGMMATIWAFQLGPLLFGAEGVSLLAIVQIFFLLFLFAGFFSAVLLTLTSFARSFKEAQAYLIPLMLVSMTPGFLSLMPGVKLNVMLAAVPLVNIVLLARDVFGGTASLSLAVVAICSTVFYSFAAIALAAKIFGTDAILYGSERTLGEVLKRPSQPRRTPSIMSAFFCLAVAFPLNFVALGGLARLGEQTINTKLYYIASATVIIFALIPLLVQIYSKVHLIQGFGLRPRKVIPFFAATLMGLACWPWAAETVRLSQLASETVAVKSSMQTAEEVEEKNRLKVEEAERQYGLLKMASPLILIFCLALVPGVCEEFFFRGIILRSILKVATPLHAIVLSAIVFGVFHVLSSNILSFDRLLPTTLMGLVLGWVCYKSGSILPGIALHTLHNASLQLLGYYRDDLVAAGWVEENLEHLPWTWLGISAVVLAVAVTTLFFSKTPEMETD